MAFTGTLSLAMSILPPITTPTSLVTAAPPSNEAVNWGIMLPVVASVGATVGTTIMTAEWPGYLNLFVERNDVPYWFTAHSKRLLATETHHALSWPSCTLCVAFHGDLMTRFNRFHAQVAVISVCTLAFCWRKLRTEISVCLSCTHTPSCRHHPSRVAKAKRGDKSRIFKCKCVYIFTNVCLWS